MTLHEERRAKLWRMRLYLVTGDRGGEEETVRIVEAALEGGVSVVQLRKAVNSHGRLWGSRSLTKICRSVAA